MITIKKIKKMKNLKFGLQLLLLSMAFPVWFIVEMKRADETSERYQQVNSAKTEERKSFTRQESNGQVNAEIKTMLYFKLMVNHD